MAPPTTFGRVGIRAGASPQEGAMGYYGWFFSTLILAYVADVCVLAKAFRPRFSPLLLANAVLLSTAGVPLWIDELTLGSRVGGLLCLANFCFTFAAYGRWIWTGEREDGPTAFFSTFGLAAFCLHVLIFSACP